MTTPFNATGSYYATTFDDGEVEFYQLENVAEPGDQPKMELHLYSKCFFGYSDVGVSMTRQTQAHSVGVSIAHVINIDLDRKIDQTFVAKMEDGELYQVFLNQARKDIWGLWYSQISLTRWENDRYETQGL